MTGVARARRPWKGIINKANMAWTVRRSIGQHGLFEAEPWPATTRPNSWMGNTRNPGGCWHFFFFHFENIIYLMRVPIFWIFSCAYNTSAASVWPRVLTEIWITVVLLGQRPSHIEKENLHERKQMKPNKLLSDGSLSVPFLHRDNGERSDAHYVGISQNLKEW